MSENLKNEQRGIEAVVKWEKSQNRIAKRVLSKEGLGCDLISEGNGETRYIEMKWEKTIGDTEYFTTALNLGKGLGNLYLYILTPRSGKLELRIIPPDTLLRNTKIVSKFSLPREHIMTVNPEVITEK